MAVYPSYVPETEKILLNQLSIIILDWSRAKNVGQSGNDEVEERARFPCGFVFLQYKTFFSQTNDVKMREFNCFP